MFQIWIPETIWKWLFATGLVCWGCCNRHYRPGGLKDGDLFSHSSQG